MKRWKKLRRKIRYTTLYVAVRFLIALSVVFPRKMWLSFFGFLGALSFYLATHSRKIAIANLTLAFGNEMNAEELRALARRVFVMIGKNAADVIRSFRITNQKTFEKLRVLHGIENAEAAFGKKRGVIFLTAHLGAFELCATEMAMHGYKPLIIGTAMKDARLTELLWRQRSKLGATAVERGKETIRLLKTLKSGGTVALLIDQDTRVQSAFVDFFGKPCATPIGAAVLALKTGASVVPVFIHLQSDGMQEITCLPEVELIRTGNEQHDIIANTQKFTSVIETAVRKHPEQWLWIHERWKTKPGG
ncbi:lysophospholipid acyltransferase family protein [Oscillatoria amoena NRMC-F 0135]|nr:lysophospholipid acyltransferase family protein [Oscillatoria amoena NRMC-F 0135]